MRTAKGPARPTSRLRGPERVAFSCFCGIPVIAAHCYTVEKQVTSNMEQRHTSVSRRDTLRERPCFRGLSKFHVYYQLVSKLSLHLRNHWLSPRRHSKLIVTCIRQTPCSRSQSQIPAAISSLQKASCSQRLSVTSQLFFFRPCFLLHRGPTNLAL